MRRASGILVGAAFWSSLAEAIIIKPPQLALCTWQQQRHLRWPPRRYYSPAASAGTDGLGVSEPLETRVKALKQRPAVIIRDYLSPTPSHLLNITLSDLLSNKNKPSASSSSPDTDRKQAPTASSPLPQGHHLVYFPIQLPPSGLAADGADPRHSPGGPFVRRMWAGGEVRFREGWKRRLLLDGRPWTCRESIDDAAVKGGPGKEKVFVDVWRRYGEGSEDAREREWDIEERRTLVFMRNEEQAGDGRSLGGCKTSTAPRRIIKHPHPPSYTFPLLPTASHLFHFSALSFNAHSIHLDREYARLDGHRSLLVHGPLSLALMLRCLGHAVTLENSSTAAAAPALVESIEYRNYAPLYVDETMRVCLRKVDAGGMPPNKQKWEVWVEGPDGGLSVRGTASIISE